MAEDIFQKLHESVMDGDPQLAEKMAKRALAESVDPIRAIEEGLLKAIRKVGDDFGKGILFLPELIQAGDACKAGISILEEEIKRSGGKWEPVGTLVIGTVKDDVHDIGKSLVASFFKTSGFNVIDLGVNVATDTFVDAVKEHNPNLLGLSSLLTTTVKEQKLIIDALERAELRSDVKILVGGGAVSPDWADEIGADGYGQNPQEAVVVAKEILGIIEERRT